MTQAWQVLPSKRGFRVWSVARQVDVVANVSWYTAHLIKLSLEANAPKREEAMRSGR